MTTQPQDADRVRTVQRDNWTIAAPGWVQRREEMTAATRSVTQNVIAAAKIGPGQRVLDLACGVGDPAFTIATVVGPSGSVMGLDLTPAMIDGAKAHAHANNIRNVEFRVIPSEAELGVEPESFDAATCRYGLMFMANPAVGLGAMFAALKPGARAAVSTWGPPDRVPFMSFPREVAGRHVTLPKPDPTERNPFTLPTREALIAVFTAAGFVNARVDIIHTDVVTAPTAEDYWKQISEAGPLVGTLKDLSEATQTAIRDDAIATLRERFPGGPVTLGGDVLIGSGIKPK
jgi:SAM-dependent methyltransferase